MKHHDSPTVKNHKRQFVWQILIPVIVLALLVITAAVFLATGGVSVTRPWADVSLMWMIMPMLFLAFFLLVVVGFMIYGVAKLLKITPIYSTKVQQTLYVVRDGARKVTDGSVKPILWVNQAAAAIKKIFKS